MTAAALDPPCPSRPPGLGTALEEGPTTELGILPHHYKRSDNPESVAQPAPRFALNDDEYGDGDGGDSPGGMRRQQSGGSLRVRPQGQPSLNTQAARQGVVVEVLPSPAALP